MPVYRVNKSKDFTVMSNCHLRDRKLSLKAKGLLSVMLALPDNWDYSINGLSAISVESESAIKSALNELKRNGYIIVTKLPPSKTESGRFEYIYDIYEKPVFQPIQEQEIEKQGVENQPLEILPGENHTVNKGTKKSNTYISNTNNKSKHAATAAPVPDQVMDIYNTTCTGLIGCRMITPERDRAIKKFMQTYDLEKWREVCEKANTCDFLKGGNERGWKADFDFLLRPDKAQRILEGKYGSGPEPEQEHHSEEMNDYFKNMRRALEK